MIILGIGGFFHDFNAGALNLHGGIVAAAEEERFSRRKHHSILGATESSIDSIHHVLSRVGSTFEAVDHVAFSDEADHPLKSTLRPLFPNARFHDIHHHLCHAAAAYYSSGFDSAAILSLDGFGDARSGVLAVGEGHSLRPLRYIGVEDSIGLEYLRVTYQIGLGSFGSEGKTQGLAPYGEPRFLDDYLAEVTLNPDGTIFLSDKLKNMQGYLKGELYLETKSLFNDFLARHIIRRFSDEPLEAQHLDMAASVQALLNIVGVHAARCLRKETGAERLVLAGGVALNSTMNGAIREQSGYAEVFPHPSASDRGNGLGAAFYLVNNVLNQPFALHQPLIYAGQEYGDEAIVSAIQRRGLSFRQVSDPSEEAALMLAESHIIGWFQGRSELGARALGNRSILADPRKAENKDILNERVKHREWFRPFAPVVPWDRAKEFFVIDAPMPYMTETAQVRDDQRSVIPAVSHVDGSARLQTVTPAFNARYHRVVERFGELTGVPVVINTSFNDAGDPIVETPDDALDCLEKSDLDAVLIGNFIVPKDRP